MLRFITNNPVRSSFLPLLMLATFFFLVVPDLIYSTIIYDLILALYEQEIKDWDLYYFSFSLHFATPFSSQGDLIKSLLINDIIGQFAIAANIILDRIIDITIIGVVGGLFIKGINNFKQKGK